MDRNRGGLTSIGETISGLGGPVKALREASPQAVLHFTRFDQVDQLVGASEADPDLGFMVRLMALWQPTPHQPRRSASVYPPQRSIHLSYACGRSS